MKSFFNARRRLGSLPPMKTTSRRYSNSSPPIPHHGKPWIRVGVVGSGPAGFYTAYKVLKKTENVQVDLLEALPIPYGLVRYGVAPDHPEVKSVQHKFEEVARDARFQFIGNVRVGSDIAVDELRQQYHALVLAYGASEDRLLHIPGEDLNHIYAARDVVGWYNGGPAQRHLKLPLDQHDSALIIGMGNVALDVARLLLTPPAMLAQTDITDYALEALSQSRIRKVTLLARRGPVQVAFTAKEFREMFQLPQTSMRIDHDLVRRELQQHEAQLKQDRPRQRLMKLLQEKMQQPRSGEGDPMKQWELAFHQTPVAFLPSDQRPNDVGQLVCQQTGSTQTRIWEAGLVVRSIGYQPVPVPGVPFDKQRNHVPHFQGRVLQSALSSMDKTVPGLYVAGWLKRGPSGVIATTMYDAFQTAESLAADIQLKCVPQKQVMDKNQVRLWMEEKQRMKTTSFSDWKRVEAEEERRGRLQGKPREKMTDMDDVLRWIGIEKPSTKK